MGLSLGSFAGEFASGLIESIVTTTGRCRRRRQFYCRKLVDPNDGANDGQIGPHKQIISLITRRARTGALTFVAVEELDQIVALGGLN